MLTVGIDAHDRHYVMCILDQKGAVVKEHTVRGGPGDVAEFLRGLGRPVRVCYEASLGYGTLYDALAPVAERIAVAHPAHLRMIFKARVKNDRIDARKIAKILLLDQVPEVHVPGKHVREWRMLIEHRRKLVDRRTGAKNALRSILRGEAIRAPKGAKLWTKAGVRWARSLEFASPLTALRRDQLLDEIEAHDRAIARVIKVLDQIGAAHPGVQLLRTIPGVGPRTAEAVVAYIDKPERFAGGSQVASYFGLVPSLEQSGRSVRYGRITKGGPATARKLLVEASWQVIRHSPSMRRFYERVKAGKKERTGRALVAVARRLVEIMAAMLKSGEAWRKEGPDQASAQAA